METIKCYKLYLEGFPSSKITKYVQVIKELQWQFNSFKKNEKNFIRGMEQGVPGKLVKTRTQGERP